MGNTRAAPSETACVAGERMNRSVLSPVERPAARAASRWSGYAAPSTPCCSSCSSSSGSGRCCGSPSRRSSTTQDTLRHPMALWPSGFDFENLVTAWRDAQIGRYFLNTVKIAVGSWLVQLFVAVTGGYVLGILRPWYARILTGAVLVTLFVPPVVLLVPLVPDGARPADRRHVVAQLLLGRSGCRPGPAPSTSSSSSGSWRTCPTRSSRPRRSTAPGRSACCVDRPADLEAGHRRRLGVRRAD